MFQLFSFDALRTVIADAYDQLKKDLLARFTESYLKQKPVGIPSFNCINNVVAAICMEYVHNLCRVQQVNYSLHFNDGSNMWHISIDGSDTEQLTTKDYSLSSVLEVTIDHLHALKRQWPTEKEKFNGSKT